MPARIGMPMADRLEPETRVTNTAWQAAPKPAPGMRRRLVGCRFGSNPAVPQGKVAVDSLRRPAAADVR